MQFMMTGLGALIMAGVCGLSAFFIVVDDRHGQAAQAHLAAAAPLTRDITSRTVDPQPLTVTEVFPRPELLIPGGTNPYRVRLTHSDTDCHIAASGELAALLDTHGCSQVIRATLTAPDARYVVTTGVFNLADEASAKLANEQVKVILDAGRGRLAGMPAGPGTDVVEDGRYAVTSWPTRCWSAPTDCRSPTPTSRRSGSCTS
jgi:hypothetical protein